MDRFTALLLGSLLVPTTLGAQDPDHVMELVSSAALQADILQVSLLFDNALDIGGYSLSVRNVPTDLQVLEVVPGDITIELDPCFVSVDIFPDGLSLGVVYFQAGTGHLPSGEHWEVHRIVYQVDSEAPLGSSPITITDDVGNPPHSTVMVAWLSGIVIEPTLIDGNVEIVEGMVRGDTNFDGTIDLADPIHLAMWLFQQGDAMTCLDAADGNDDGSVDVGDVMILLYYLFLSFDGIVSGNCEADPSPDSLDCTVPNCP